MPEETPNKGSKEHIKLFPHEINGPGPKQKDVAPVFDIADIQDDGDNHLLENE